ncbi:MAG: hypothetical protein HPY53_10215 [Brevinematales bacterium]|nr:hypothetical protein [Brevinematales bacterium]
MWYRIIEGIKLLFLTFASLFFVRSILSFETRADLIFAIDIAFYTTVIAILFHILALARKDTHHVSASAMANLVWFGFLKFIIPINIFLSGDQLLYHSDFLIILSLVSIFFLLGYFFSTFTIIFPRKNTPKIGSFTLIALSFASIIMVGTMLLYLPVSRSQPDVPLSLLDAVFTATSAVCVTGLTIVDTGTFFSRFGQTVILAMIQIGALGIMTFAGFFWTVIGEKMSLYNRFTTQNAVNELNAKSTGRFLYSIILTTFIIELIGAGLLFIRFSSAMPLGDAIYSSVFHSVSAFYNAGFSLFPDSLMKYRGDWLINWTIMSLIFLGGIGFAVMVNVIRRMRQRERRLSLHSKIVLLASGFLILFGAVVFFLLENDNIFKDAGINDTFLGVMFSSVTARTAGFNTVDFGAAKDVSLLFFSFLMFIGASPGSTGGGIKTSTFVIILYTIFNTLRERRSVTLMRREITLVTVRKALTIFFLSLIWVMFVIVVISSIERLPDATAKFPIAKVIFECVSAFGTVGLSAGITSKLSEASKIMIVLTMFLGRVGPLSLVFALGLIGKTTRLGFPEEKVLIG